MSTCQTARILSLVTTTGSAEDARRLAQGLLAQRLAACVQVEPGITSVYRWQGEACEDAEWRLTAKTLPQRLDALLAWLAGAHPYAVPQVVWQEMLATPAYADWVRQEVSDD